MLNEVIDQNLGIDVINRVFAKIGVTSNPVLLGAGSYGLAYTYQGSDQVYKLTEDTSEAAEAMKISGFNNKYLADVYGVYELQYDALNKRMFLIILEKLRTETSHLKPLFRELINTNAGIDFVSLMGLYGKNMNLYNKESREFIAAISDKPEVVKLYNALLNISTDLAKHHIKSTDFHPNNLGYKKDGTLAFFDMGFSNSNISSHSLPSIELEEMIKESLDAYININNVDEKRSNPELNKKTTPIEKIKNLVDTKLSQNPANYFISFRDDHNVTIINRNNKFDTPTGLYVYPYGGYMDSLLQGVEDGIPLSSLVPFAGSNTPKYMYVYGIKSYDGVLTNTTPFEQLRNYFEALNTNIKTKNSVKMVVEELLNNWVSLSEYNKSNAISLFHENIDSGWRFGSDISILWGYLTKALSPNEFSIFCLKSGINGFVDNGTGFIHTNEKSQAVFFRGNDFFNSIDTIPLNKSEEIVKTNYPDTNIDKLPTLGKRHILKKRFENVGKNHLYADGFIVDLNGKKSVRGLNVDDMYGDNHITGYFNTLHNGLLYNSVDKYGKIYVLDGKNGKVIVDKSGREPSDELLHNVLSFRPYLITYINNPSEAQQLAAVSGDGTAIQHIENPSEEVQLAAVSNVYIAIKHIKNPTQKVQSYLIDINPNIIQAIRNPSEQTQLAAVSNNGDLIKYIIKNGIIPTEAVQLAAVSNNSDAIRHIVQVGINPSAQVKAVAAQKGNDNLTEEQFTTNDISQDKLNQIYNVFKSSYEKNTGNSWDYNKFVNRAHNWTFYGDENGYVSVRKQKSGYLKLVGVAGSLKSIYKGFQELKATNLPIWGMVSGDIKNMLLKNGFRTPNKLEQFFLMKAIPKEVFGGVDYSKNPDGSLTFKYGDVGEVNKFFLANDLYFSKIKSDLMSKGGDSILKGLNLKEDIDVITERIMTFMPDAKSVEVKKKCQLGGNPDGTSEPCNKGDINNIILKEIKDTISENLKRHRYVEDITVKLYPNGEGVDVEHDETDIENANKIDIPLDQLVLNEPASKMRSKESKENLKGMIQAVKNGEELPPILVRKFNGRYQILDGHHRYFVAKKLGLQTIKAIVVPDENIYVDDDNALDIHIDELNAFHGTPNKFDAFSMDMVGSSDGRVVGGWGLYFSDDQGVASQYSTRSGGIMHVELPNGRYLDFDDSVDDQLAQEILSDENIPENQREQFQNDFYDESYRYDTTNKQVYEWLSAILGGNKEASRYLLHSGFVGNKFKDKTNPNATNYVLFDTRNLRNMGYVGDNEEEMDEYLGYVQEMVKFELMKLNEDQQMQSNSGFDLKTFDNIRSFSKRKQYADQTLQKLGAGSARIVYQMPDGNVLKLARNEKGLAQNEEECGLGQDQYFGDILTQIRDCDTNDLWVISEKANKISPKRFKELTGVSIENLEAYISQSLNKESWHKLSPDIMEKLGEIDFVSQITELANSYNLAAGDLGRISSYGEVNRSGQPEVVLIDYGATEDVMKQHYNKQKVRNIWEGYFDEVNLHDMVLDELKNILDEQGAAKTDINTLPFKRDVEAAGGKIFSVGGAVRDSMLGKDSKDLDILITGIQEDKLEEILKRHGRVDNVGKSFGIIKFNHPSTGEIDIALPRTEVPNNQGGYRGFDVKADHTLPIEKDLERRDFTINAIAKDDSGNLIDPYGGMEDIQNKQIKMVNPNAFGDDPLRMLRAVQFASRFGFTIEPNTMASIQKNASKIKEISPERYLIEFGKIVEKGNPEIGAKLLAETGLFSQIFGVEPKFNEAELKGVKTMGEFFYQLMKYTIPDPAEFYKKQLKGDLETYNEMKAYDLAYKDNSNNPVQNKLTVFSMYKTFPNSVNSSILPDNIKKNIKEMTGLGMPFSFKDLQVNGNDMLALGYTGQQIGKLLKDMLIDIYSGKIRNNKELLMRQITPLDMNPTKIN